MLLVFACLLSADDDEVAGLLFLKFIYYTWVKTFF